MSMDELRSWIISQSAPYQCVPSIPTWPQTFAGAESLGGVFFFQNPREKIDGGKTKHQKCRSCVDVGSCFRCSVTSLLHYSIVLFF